MEGNTYIFWYFPFLFFLVLFPFLSLSCTCPYPFPMFSLSGPLRPLVLFCSPYPPNSIISKSPCSFLSTQVHPRIKPLPDTCCTALYAVLLNSLKSIYFNLKVC